MTSITPTAAAPHGQGWFSRSEAWLDSKGKGAWIAAMVLGFVFFWPIGLALLFYMIWSKRMFNKSCRHRKSWTRHGMSAMTSSGNSAFDAYKADTLRRLEQEQDDFNAFLQRLREAKDKAEFDEFMEQRAAAPAEAQDIGDEDIGDKRH
ncbi:DUF2852 domain-containing protein [Phaeobacter gallaeciensis]|uniref:DUF2852 domain-containing protein n=1 Tax=Phaeobacter gallaeciensis TaxID=60890 RepID=UPI00237F60A0|nr:DUF2852 domain-containing protein [Phaeobacter gallaeciensis]MDE4192620.1 DUF2852 domain-containing protein [Phaeobacter gallaeciensis]MDE4200913.1 DUF2852 domain-containing protein [Phaeobacter gallaeciensis]MDE4205066.1 DUF2852 domain-containing protein [Phaeobacter gallaeciensis]MDE4209205.1 DUF2852 domain-containing protein [Phaeobacter gallaeciensis]MDE4217743.1 DUF2852 domain-containing protein [Phaeobacter gallaeciensis]